MADQSKLREWARETREELDSYTNSVNNMESVLRRAGESLVRECAEIADESDNDCTECNGCGHMVGLRILREFGLDEKEKA